MDEVVVILHTDDLGNAARLVELARRHIAHAELANQALLLELGQCGKLFLDRALARSVNAADAQVDHVERVNPEVSEVVVDGALEVRSAECRDPGGVVSAHGTDLGHDHEVIGVGMKRLANKLIGDVWAIEIAGINVIDPAHHRFAQHGEGRVAIFRRSKHARPGELHGAVAQTVYDAVAEPESACGGDVGHGYSPNLTCEPDGMNLVHPYNKPL